jgi:hypothetical protein
MMVALETRSGTVTRIDRAASPWRGAHGTPDTLIDLDGTLVRYPGAPSVGAGDILTVVGRRRAHRLEAIALRNESTNVSYLPSVWPATAVAVALLGVAAPLLGFPIAVPLLLAGALAVHRVLQHHRVRVLLHLQPSRHGTSATARPHARGHESRR